MTAGHMRPALRHLVLGLLLAVAGCGMADAPEWQRLNRIYQERLNMMMVPLPSAEDTNRGIWMDMQGGG